MCGITGYVGNDQAEGYLLSGLEKLEYRGYDSAGSCVVDGGNLKISRVKGRLKNLIEQVKNEDMGGHIGIGHTRWATHGAPTVKNSHPQFSNDMKFAVVHNGIIENYQELKTFLAEKGFTFNSETDTEVIPQLMQYYYNGDVFETFTKVVSKLEGAYALELVSSYEPDTIYATRKDSPLIAGIGKGQNFIASDIPAILEYTREVYLLEKGEYAIVTKDGIQLVDKDKNPIKKDIFHVTWDVNAAEKGGYEFFMLKEIMEQPKAINDTIKPRINGNRIDMSELNLDDDYFKKLSKVFVVACGSAYHVGLIGKNIIEGLGRVPVEADLASEFRYRNPVINKDDLVIIISQSGETSDTLAALRYAKEHGARILSIVNVKGSSIARESDDVLYTHAGPEIAVATTKAYSTQMDVLILLGLHIANLKGNISESECEKYIAELKTIPDKVQSLLKDTSKLEELGKKFKDVKDVFFIGRGIDYSISMEGSLKLKEISYIHSEAYAAGELKHGTISLIEDGTLVIALATQEHLFEKMLSNIKEVKARGAYVIAVAQEGNTAVEKEADCVIYIPRTDNYFAGALEVIPLQVFAYYISKFKGLEVDKPRNLAKSVTVE